MPGIDACLLEAMKLPGARGAAVVDWTSGLALGTVGESPAGDHEVSAAETAELARMAAEQPSFAVREFTGRTHNPPPAAGFSVPDRDAPAGGGAGGPVAGPGRHGPAPGGSPSEGSPSEGLPAERGREPQPNRVPSQGPRPPAEDRPGSPRTAGGPGARPAGANAHPVPAGAHGAYEVPPLACEDVIVSASDSYHLLHFVRTDIDSSVFLYLWLRRDDGNLALARLRLRDLADRLVWE